MFEGSGTTVTKGSPEAFASAAGQAGERISNMLTQLMNGLAPLESSWKGLGGTSFQQVKLTVEEQTNKLTGALNGLGNDVGLVGANYNTADDESGGKMNEVQSTTTGITDGLTMGSQA